MADLTLEDLASDTLLAVAIALRDDMVMRAKMDAWQNDGEIVVEAGAGVWARFNQGIDAALRARSNLSDVKGE